MRLIALALFLAGGSLLTAADPAPDWSKFANHGKIKGVVSKVELNQITLEVPSLVNGKGGNNNDGNNGNPGGKNRKPNVRVGKDEVELAYAAEGMVRWLKMPVKPDGKGGTLPATSRELEDAKKPVGAPGFAALRTELRPGHIVEVHLVRPKDIPASKVKDADLTIKYVMIEGEGKAPAAAEEKKKKQ